MLTTKPQLKRARWLPLRSWFTSLMLFAITGAAWFFRAQLDVPSLWLWVGGFSLLHLLSTFHSMATVRVVNQHIVVRRLRKRQTLLEGAKLMIFNTRRGRWSLRVVNKRKRFEIVSLPELKRLENVGKRIGKALELEFEVSADHKRAKKAQRPFKVLARLWSFLLGIAIIALLGYIAYTLAMTAS